MLDRVWNAFVAQHPHGHLLQTTHWGALKASFGWDSQLLTLGSDEQPVAGAQVLYRRLRRGMPLGLAGPWPSIAYLPKGPVVDWGDQSLVASLLSLVAAKARKQGAILIRIEPEVAQGKSPALVEQLEALGFQSSPRAVQPRRTLILDISGGEGEILGRMKQKTRYNIRLAQRKGVLVRRGTSSDLSIFAQLMQETGSRNVFGVHSLAYYHQAYDSFGPDDRVALFVAEYEDQPLGAIMAFALGDTAWYFYGASSSKERRRMPSYLLQWEAIRWARGKGCARYDLWGVPDEDEEVLEDQFTNRSDGLWGVYRFKRGFGGQLVRWVGAFDLPLNRSLYGLVRRIGL